MIAALFAWAFLLAFVAWLLVVAPLQYFVYLLTGAPARAACASDARAWYRVTPREIQVEETWKSNAIPEGASESGFSARPVSFTAAITTAALFAVSVLVA